MPTSVRQGQLIGDRYRITARLGGGGYGEVHRAVHVGTHEEVAVKILRAELLDSPAAVQRFTAEARLCAGLRHPNTLRVFDFGQTPAGAPYLAMEMLRGQSLAEVLRDGGRLGPSRVVAIAIQVLKSLVEAHARGVVHRDLKPANVLLCEVMGEVDFVKVIDFGIARLVVGASDLTATGQVVGTTHFMCPEQIRGVDLDGRADLYALGVLMYRCLSGVLPFDGPTGPAVIAAHLQDAPAPLAERVPGLDPRLEGVVMRALSKAADDRYPSADAMLEALRACAGLGAPNEGGTATATAEGRQRPADEKPPVPRTLGASLPPGLRAGLGATSSEASGLHGPMAKAARSGRLVALLAVLSIAAIAVVAFWFAEGVQRPKPTADKKGKATGAAAPATAPAATAAAPNAPTPSPPAAAVTPTNTAGPAPSSGAAARDRPAGAPPPTGVDSPAAAASPATTLDPLPPDDRLPLQPAAERSRRPGRGDSAACAQPGSRAWCGRCTEAADRDWCTDCRALMPNDKWCARCPTVSGTRAAWCSNCGGETVAKEGSAAWCACLAKVTTRGNPTWCRRCMLPNVEQASDDDWCGCMKTLARTADETYRCRCVVEKQHDPGTKEWCDCHPSERILCRWRSDSPPMGRLTP